MYLFHGVVDQHDAPVRNYTRKHISTRTFSRVLDSLKQAGTPVSMDQIVEHHTTRESLPAKAFAITFDDGFENNYSVAAGVLQAFGIPATFYLFRAPRSYTRQDIVEIHTIGSPAVLDSIRLRL
ncbi:MAG: polysaccharide deacetylase family protein, partial [Planctomycetes bacterium]|nr:polysaccharide deacetylase family protein [Planctomycetota bacterium]